jgi:hypothetical protein
MIWRCSCGFSTESGNAAFLHRDREAAEVHNISPQPEQRLSGLEREFLRGEIKDSARGK